MNVGERPSRGVFIAVEGGDGAGKSGVIVTLKAALEERGHDLLVTREPGGTLEGEQLRALLLSSSGPRWESEAELLLVTAARVQHAKRVIVPALQAGKIVISDRFVGSTLAYQGAGHGVPSARILDLHRLYVGDLWPDLTIILDVDPQVGLARSRGRLAQALSDESRFEELGGDFHTRVRTSFLEQAQADPKHYAVLNAHQPATVVQSEAVQRLLATVSAAH